MPIHSKFIVHWTKPKGKNNIDPRKWQCKGIGEEYDKLYVQLLESILDPKKGLLMNFEKGEVNDDLKTNLKQVCFTEMRLRDVAYPSTINKDYGYLGIAFHREFIIKRGGNPVFYLENRDNSNIIRNFVKLYDDIKSKKEGAQRKGLLTSMQAVLGYLKLMSKPEDIEHFEHFEHYEDLEWRVVDQERLRKEKYTVEMPDTGELYLIYGPEDVKFIIFPRHQTKERSLDFLAEYFSNFKSQMPGFITVNETTHF